APEVVVAHGAEHRSVVVVVATSAANHLSLPSTGESSAGQEQFPNEVRCWFVEKSTCKNPKGPIPAPPFSQDFTRGVAPPQPRRASRLGYQREIVDAFEVVAGAGIPPDQLDREDVLAGRHLPDTGD